jgi:uncharacterized protein with PQ loop repeat
MELIGWIGTTLVVIAYYPQIYHLYAEKCAWGISVTTWLIWLASSTVLLVYALSRLDITFVVVQSINILSITVTIALVRRSDNICPYHISAVQEYAKGSRGQLNSPAGISNRSARIW